MLTALRWLAIVPAALGVWWLTLLLGLGLADVAILLCPPEELISGMCAAPWYRYVEGGLIMGCAGLAAVLIVVVSAVLAPSHRLCVASAVLGGGVIVALYMAYAAGAWGSFAAAVLAGTTGWSGILWWTRRALRSANALVTDACAAALLRRAPYSAAKRGR